MSKSEDEIKKDRDRSILEAFINGSRKEEEFHYIPTLLRKKSVQYSSNYESSIETEIAALSDTEYEYFSELDWGLGQDIPISNLTAAIIDNKPKVSYIGDNYDYYNENVGTSISSLYLLALRSALYSNDNSSLYSIFKNAENLIPDIIAESQTSKEDRIKNGNSLQKKGNFYYYELSKKNQNLKKILEPYDILIPSTHVDNLDPEIIDILKKITFTPLIINYQVRRVKFENKHFRRFYKDWKKITEDQICVIKTIEKLEKLSIKLEERVKKIDLRDGDIISEFNTFEESIIKDFRNLGTGKKISESLKKFAENFILYYDALSASIDEMTDIQFAIVYLNFLGKNIITRSSNVGETFMAIFAEAVHNKSEKHRKEMYSFLETIALYYDFEKPTLSTLRATLEVDDLEDLPPEIMFSMMGKDGAYQTSRVKNPVYSTKILKKYKK